jgi:hypothetical protein
LRDGRNGVKGMIPACCLPLWGREGVTLIAYQKEWRVTGFLQSQKTIINQKKLFITSFKHAFFCLEDFTFRAAPGIRNVFKTGSGTNSGFWISFYRIIDIVTFKADPSFVFIIS